MAEKDEGLQFVDEDDQLWEDTLKGNEIIREIAKGIKNQKKLSVEIENHVMQAIVLSTVLFIKKGVKGKKTLEQIGTQLNLK